MDAAIFKSLSILFGVSSTNAATGVDFEELAETEDDLVDLLCELASGRENDGLAFG